MKLNFQVEFFGVVTHCNIVVAYQCFGEPSYLHLQGDGGITVLRNVGIIPQPWTASQRSRPRLESSPP